jgi:hypothetical protein
LQISGRTAYSIENNVEKIKHEIMTNGPVEAAFTVFADFLQYKSGSYVHNVMYKYVCISTYSRMYKCVCISTYSRMFSEPTLPTLVCSCIPRRPTEIEMLWRSGAAAYSGRTAGAALALHSNIKQINVQVIL